MTLTPKEKANQLVEEFFDSLNLNEEDTTYSVISPFIKLKLAKQSALVAIKFAQSNPLNTDGYNKYLQDIKQEIEKL
jgi:hypothetical protein